MFGFILLGFVSFVFMLISSCFFYKVVCWVDVVGLGFFVSVVGSVGGGIMSGLGGVVVVFVGFV